MPEANVGSVDWLGTVIKVGFRGTGLRSVPVPGNAHNSRCIVDAIDNTIGRQNKLPNVAVCKFANDASRTGKRREGFRLLNKRYPNLRAASGRSGLM
jgi:hypothetical protein